MEEQERKMQHRPTCDKYSNEDAVPSTSQDEPLLCDCEQIKKTNLIGFCNDHNYFMVESRQN